MQHIFVIFSALQCHLECNPGFISSLSSTVTCVGGKYEPRRPQEFTCQLAAAIIVTAEGEVEVFSKIDRCRTRIVNQPPLSTIGLTLTLFKDSLVLVGYQVDDGKWSYFEMVNPREGLLSNSWKTRTTIGSNMPQFHTSFTFGRSLFLLGGELKTPIKIDMNQVNTAQWRH